MAIATLGFSIALMLRDRVDPWRSTALAAVLGAGIGLWALGARAVRCSPSPLAAPWCRSLLGSLFVAQRIVTGRLTDALLSHVVWSVAVFVVVPLV